MMVQGAGIGASKMRQIYSIGHSSHTPEHFIELLQRDGIKVLVDV